VARSEHAIKLRATRIKHEGEFGEVVARNDEHFRTSMLTTCIGDTLHSW
jgi:hypothetical protein